MSGVVPDDPPPLAARKAVRSAQVSINSSSSSNATQQPNSAASLEGAVTKGMLQSLRITIMEELRKETREALESQTERIRQRILTSFEAEVSAVIGGAAATRGGGGGRER